MFKMLRFYAIAGFINIFIASALITLFYRELNIDWISGLVEKSNRPLAQAALNSVKPGLVAYLESSTKAVAPGNAQVEFPPDLVATIKSMTRETPVTGFRAYHRDGRVAFSTTPGQIGTIQSGNPGVKSALGGAIATHLAYRDAFSFMKQANAEDNLLKTYIPVRGLSGPAVLGVFELDTDVSGIVQDNSRSLSFFLVGTGLVLALLYAALVFVARRTRKAIEIQQQSILERTAALETLSRRLIKSEEVKNKKIANDLHEGLAQTLSAIKANVESSRQRMHIDDEHTQSLESIVPVIQSAIQEVRSIATELRPSSLDDLGLIPTLNWMCREFTRLHPEMQIERYIELPEAGIPVALKIVIFRIIEMTLENIAQHAETDRIELALQLEDETITLEIAYTSTAQAMHPDLAPDPKLRFADMRERTILSYGEFSVTRNRAGGIRLYAAWSGVAQGSAEQNR